MNQLADNLVTQLGAKNEQIAAKEKEVLGLQVRVAPLLAELTKLNGEISATEASLKALQAQSITLDAQVVAAQTVLRDLQSKKGPNKAAVADQKAVVSGLEVKLGEVQNQIKAIDGSIQLGGCVA